MNKRGFGILLLGGVVVALLTACGGPDQGQAQKSNFLPPMGFKGDATQGQPLYVKNCGICHGRSGQGTQKGPPLIHKIYEPSHHGDFSFYTAAAKGVTAHHWKFGNMPPVPGVTPEQVAHIIAFVRREQRAAGIR